MKTITINGNCMFAGKCPFTGNLFLYRKNITNYDFKDASGLQVLICKQEVAHSMKPVMQCFKQ
jgi:hypothetical protein